MQRVIAALMLITIAFGVAGAQGQEKNEPQAEPDAWILRGVMSDIPLSDMMIWTTEYSGMVFLYNPSNIKGEFTVVAPRAGVKVEPGKMPAFFQNALEQYRLCIVKNGEVWNIIPMAEAATLAPKLTEEELAAADAGLWAVVHVPLKNADANSVTGAMRNLTSRMGGMVQPVPPSSLIICDRVDRLRELVKMVHQIDDSMQFNVVRYDLPEGMDAPETSRALGELFASSGPTFGALPNGKSILAKATADDHILIAEAVKALGQK